MREFTGAFLGTLAAIAFAVGLVCFLVYREARALELVQAAKRASAKEPHDTEPDAKREGFGGAADAPQVPVSDGGNYRPKDPVLESPPDNTH